MDKQFVRELVEKVDSWVAKNHPNPLKQAFKSDLEEPLACCWVGALSYATGRTCRDAEQLLNNVGVDYLALEDVFDDTLDFNATSRWILDQLED